MEQIKVIDCYKRNYVIPCFQREYSWEEEEIIGLINNIKNNNTKLNYCIGVVTVQDNDNELLLIDGQQRLITLYLIAIRCGLITKKEDIMLNLEYEKMIGKDNIFINLIKKEFDNVPKKLSNGYKIVEKSILEEEIADFKELLKNVYYYEIHLDKNVDINHYFEVMNSRGVQLSKSDIVKSILMKHLKDNEKEKTKLNNLWYKYEKMDDNQNSYKDSKIPKTAYKSINQILSNNKEADEDISLGLKNEMDDNSILTFEYFLLYVIRLYKNRNEEEDNISGEFNLDDLIEEYNDYFNNEDADVLDFINYMKKMKEVYNKYIVKYDDSNENWKLGINNDDTILIESCLRVSFTNRKTMHWIYKTMKYFYKNNNCDVTNIKRYNEKMKNYIRSEYIKKYIDDAKDKAYKTGFDTPNIVLNYLDYIIKKNYKKITSDILEVEGLEPQKFKFKFRNSIEHFEPRHGDNAEKNREWLDDFGNLALLAYRTNTRIQNSEVIDKVKFFEKNLSEYSLKLQIMVKVAASKGWNKEECEKIKNKMIELLENDCNNIKAN